jgi:NAD(P)-dependent dehydrogenase (short-subunit alcohol dehydrogenase family)
MVGKGGRLRFDGKVVAVSGAGRGIGKNIADLFERLGATVARCDRKASELNVDLSTPNAGRALVSEILQKFGRIDVLVNNARSNLRNMLWDETEENWDFEMAVGVRAPYFLSKHAIQKMNGGAIVNVGSVTANMVSHESAAYQVSKGAQLQLTRVLAKMGAFRGVRVNAVLPGSIIQDEHRDRYNQADNELYRQKMDEVHLTYRPGTSDEIANAVAFLASDLSSFTTGASLVIDGGLTIQDLLAFHMKR